MLVNKSLNTIKSYPRISRTIIGYTKELVQSNLIFSSMDFRDINKSLPLVVSSKVIDQYFHEET